ncbi:MAG: GGDEF domain-containing protein [Spirochaetes bacterium]|nr:GGDEF domain-containing protein [Spirochaetota bacterium]
MKDISTQEKIGILQCVDFFARLNREELEIAAMSSEVARIPRGTVLFRESEQSMELYIVRDGEVLITKHKDCEEDIDLAQYLPVECFGELDLFGARARDATAVTVKDSSILIFPKRGIDFPDLLQAYPRVSAVLLRNLLSTVSDRVRNIHRHIGERSMWVEGLRRVLNVDRLTGLYNKNYLMEQLQGLLRPDGEGACILMIKPDNFKTLNDRYGHAAGDKVLVLIAIFIQSVLREGDIALRYWGDEFMIILNRAGRDTAVAAAREIARAIRDVDLSRIATGKKMTLSVSMGGGFYPSDSSDRFGAVTVAHDRMMRARERGGNVLIMK